MKQKLQTDTQFSTIYVDPKKTKKQFPLDTEGVLIYNENSSKNTTKDKK